MKKKKIQRTLTFTKPNSYVTNYQASYRNTYLGWVPNNVVAACNLFSHAGIKEAGKYHFTLIKNTQGMYIVYKSRSGNLYCFERQSDKGCVHICQTAINGLFGKIRSGTRLDVIVKKVEVKK